MQRTTKIIAAGLAGLIALGGGSAAFAAAQRDPAPADAQRKAAKKAPPISRERAIQIARAKAPGAKVTEVEHEHREWEVELRKGAVEHEFDIDDRTGKILEHEVEIEDD